MDINECTDASHLCSSYATCTNTDGSYSCSCNTSYSGDGLACEDINECTDGSHQCSTNATCTNTVGSYICSCNIGFTGDGRNGVNGCVDINECEDSHFLCPEHSMCSNTIGGYKCLCKEEFAQRGNFCQKAECPSGQYTPDGVTCNDCPVNTYNNIDDYLLSECSPCPTLHTTVGPGADSVTQCRSKMIFTTSNLFIEKSNTALRRRMNTNFN